MTDTKQSRGERFDLLYRLWKALFFSARQSRRKTEQKPSDQ